MSTVGQINKKISLLRSKIAVTEGVVLYLKTHFMAAEPSEPEMRFTRSDYGQVHQDDVGESIADFVEYLDSLKLELAALEQTPVSLPVTKLQPELRPTPPKPRIVATPKPKEKVNGTESRSKDQPPAKQALPR